MNERIKMIYICESKRGELFLLESCRFIHRKNKLRSTHENEKQFLVLTAFLRKDYIITIAYIPHLCHSLQFRKDVHSILLLHLKKRKNAK